MRRQSGGTQEGGGLTFRRDGAPGEEDVQGGGVNKLTDCHSNGDEI